MEYNHPNIRKSSQHLDKERLNSNNNDQSDFKIRGLKQILLTVRSQNRTRCTV